MPLLYLRFTIRGVSEFQSGTLLMTQTMAGAMEVIFFVRPVRSRNQRRIHWYTSCTSWKPAEKWSFEWLWRWCEIRRCFHTWPRVVTRSDSQWFSGAKRWMKEITGNHCILYQFCINALKPSLYPVHQYKPSSCINAQLRWKTTQAWNVACEASAAAAALRRPIFAWAKCQLIAAIHAPTEGTVRHFDHQKWLKWASMIYWKWWVTVQFIAKVHRTLYRGCFLGEKLQLRFLWCFFFVKRATSQIVFTCLGKPLVPSVLRSRLWARRHVMKEHLQRSAS